jgi:hypothetical protein
MTLPTFASPAFYDAICPLIDYIDGYLPDGLVGALTNGEPLDQLLADLTAELPPGALSDLVTLLTNGTATGSSCGF